MLAGIFLSLSGFGRMEEADYTFPVEYGGGVVVSPTGKKRLMTSDEVLGAPREFLSVSAYEEGTVSVTIANVWERDIQIWSREGSLSGWLEARVGGIGYRFSGWAIVGVQHLMAGRR